MTGQPGSSRQESFRIDGSDLMDKAKQLVDEGNKHRVVVLNEEGKPVFDIPLTVAVVGGIIVFPATAVGVIAALATRHSIVVQSVETETAPNGAAAADEATTNGASAATETATSEASATEPAAATEPTAADAPPSAPPPTAGTPYGETAVTPPEGTPAPDQAL